jgi:hypothetical protein
LNERILIGAIRAALIWRAGIHGNAAVDGEPQARRHRPRTAYGCLSALSASEGTTTTP